MPTPRSRCQRGAGASAAPTRSPAARRALSGPAPKVVQAAAGRPVPVRVPVDDADSRVPPPSLHPASSAQSPTDTSVRRHTMAANATRPPGDLPGPRPPGDGARCGPPPDGYWSGDDRHPTTQGGHRSLVDRAGRAERGGRMARGPARADRVVRARRGPRTPRHAAVRPSQARRGPHGVGRPVLPGDRGVGLCPRRPRRRALFSRLPAARPMALGADGAPHRHRPAAHRESRGTRRRIRRVAPRARPRVARTHRGACGGAHGDLPGGFRARLCVRRAAVPPAVLHWRRGDRARTTRPGGAALRRARAPAADRRARRRPPPSSPQSERPGPGRRAESTQSAA